MIVLDTSVLIAYLDNIDRHHRRAEELLVREIDESLGVNALTLGEVFVGPVRQGRLDQVQTILGELGLVGLPFPDATALKLATLRSETHLRMPDCCVLLAAQLHGARVASFDARLLAAANAQGLDLVEA